MTNSKKVYSTLEYTFLPKCFLCDFAHLTGLKDNSLLTMICYWRYKNICCRCLLCYTPCNDV